MINMRHLISYIAVPIPKLELANQLWELIIKLHSFFQVLFVDLLSNMPMEFTLIDDFFVNLSFGFWSVGIFVVRFIIFLFVETSKV